MESQASFPTTVLKPGKLITTRPGTRKELLGFLNAAAGIAGASVASTHDNADGSAPNDAPVIILDGLNGTGASVAVVDADDDQFNAIAVAMDANPAIVTVEDEPIFYALGMVFPPEALAYLHGYRDGVDQLYQELAQKYGDTNTVQPVQDTVLDTALVTWGIAATRAGVSSFSGHGVKVAVLDTGFDLNHPDFAGRNITSASFITGETVQDGNGHGTHCIGTACGSAKPETGPRYGVASEADIYAGKVLSNSGFSLGRSTLLGMQWAILQGCHIISMSLGSRVLPGQPYLEAFEAIAQEGRERGCLTIAAAGNESRRRLGFIAPVGSPANCPSILAVAAVDRAFTVADFSCGSINSGANVDIAAPGVNIYSSLPMPTRYTYFNGTSMATPHVAGVAALLRQQNPTLTAAQLAERLRASAKRLSGLTADIGSGLVQSP